MKMILSHSLNLNTSSQKHLILSSKSWKKHNWVVCWKKYVCNAFIIVIQKEWSTHPSSELPRSWKYHGILSWKFHGNLVHLQPQRQRSWRHIFVSHNLITVYLNIVFFSSGLHWTNIEMSSSGKYHINTLLANYLISCAVWNTWG